MQGYQVGGAFLTSWCAHFRSQVRPEELEGMKPTGISGSGPPGPDDVPKDVVALPNSAPTTNEGPSAQVLHLTYWEEVPRQTIALLNKNFILVEPAPPQA
jgi:hypothetical protein